MTMYDQDFVILKKVISQRRTRKPAHMNGQSICPEWIDDLLQLADYAPTHGRTEPWRFIVLTGADLQEFCLDHARLYREHTPEEKWNPAKFEKIKTLPEKVSHLIIVVMKRTPHARIPASEEYAATSAAVQNLLLGAEAMGLAAIWSTGGMATTPEMKAYWQLDAADRIVAFVYLGFTDDTEQTPVRKIPIAEKIIGSQKFSRQKI